MDFLPGSDKQIKYLKANEELENKTILVVGSASAPIAVKLARYSGSVIELIVEDYDSLINSKIEIDDKDKEKVNIKLMDFERTDYEKEQFDLIYAQASVSSINRVKIIKELKKILKPGGIFCVGEIISLKENPPQVVKNLWADGGLMPLTAEEIEKFYTERNFEIVKKIDFSDELEVFYSNAIEELKKVKNNLSPQELSYHKKLLNRISHESKVYLRQGGDKVIGFRVLILKKG